MSTLVLKKLKAMIGKTFMYKSRNIIISNYHVLGDEGVTQVDIEDGNGVPLPPVKVKDLSTFIEHCLPVDDSKETGVSTQVVQETNSILSTLQQTLLDNIEKVKKDPAYIKQANVVNSSVNSMIGLAKLHLQVNKMKQ